MNMRDYLKRASENKLDEFTSGPGPETTKRKKQFDKLFDKVEKWLKSEQKKPERTDLNNDKSNRIWRFIQDARGSIAQGMRELEDPDIKI